MDPLTHARPGATAAQVALGPRLGPQAWMLGLLFSAGRRSRLPAGVALLLAVAYVGGAAWQRERALDAQAQIAAARGHQLVRAEMFPTVGNPILWRSVYQSGTTLFIDRLWILGDDNSLCKQGSRLKLFLGDDLSPQTLADPRLPRLRCWRAGRRGHPQNNLAAGRRYSSPTPLRTLSAASLIVQPASQLLRPLRSFRLTPGREPARSQGARCEDPVKA